MIPPVNKVVFTPGIWYTETEERRILSAGKRTAGEWMKPMKRKRWIAAVLALSLLAAFAGSAGAEARPLEEKKNGKTVRVTWVDEADQPAAGPEGYACVRYTYSGKSVTESYTDTEGKPCMAGGGYYGRTETRDGKNRITEIRYLDAEGGLTLNAWGYARVTFTYTGFGAIRRLSYYGTGKKRVNVPSLGYAAIEYDYRGQTMTGRTYVNAGGRAVDTALGYASMTQKVNKKNQITGISYEHANGTPALCEEGWSSCEIQRDKDGRETRISYYGTDKNPVNGAAGYAREEIRYPSEREKRITRYDAAGNPVAWEGGYITLVQTMKNGRVIRETFLDAAGNRIARADGTGALNYSYDAEGQLTETAAEPITAETNP